MDNPAPDAPFIFRPRLARGAAKPLLVLVLAALAGCAGEGARPPSREDGKAVSARPTWTTSSQADAVGPAASAEKPAAAERKTWSILLGAFGGPGADRQAATLAALAAREGNMPGAFVERKGEGFAALYGSYDDPSTPQARKDLAAARAVTIAGAHPFASAIMAAPGVVAEAGTTPEWDLSKVRQLQNIRKNAVTLQIGMYLRSDNQAPTQAEVDEFRRSAEEAVRVLRSQGEQAFYFHARERSTVTIGVFDDANDPRIAEVRKRFPLHMLNGQTTVNAKSAVGGPKGQPTFPAGIP